MWTGLGQNRLLLLGAPYFEQKTLLLTLLFFDSAFVLRQNSRMGARPDKILCNDGRGT